MRGLFRIHRSRTAFWLLAAVIALRSLIAPGFMLDFDDDSPLGVSIILCGGWTGASEVEVFDDVHAMHHLYDTSAAHDNQSDNGSAENTECGVWATSSTFIQAVVITLDSTLEYGPDGFITPHRAPLYRNSSQRPQQPRAPPVSLLI